MCSTLGYICADTQYSVYARMTDHVHGSDYTRALYMYPISVWSHGV